MSEARLPISAESRASLARKRRLHQLPPQRCPGCKADLSDAGVPDRYAGYKSMFGLAVEITLSKNSAAWQCPSCSLRFGKHVSG